MPQRCAVCNRVVSIGQDYCYRCVPKLRRVSLTLQQSAALSPKPHFRTGKGTLFDGCTAPFFNLGGSRKIVYNYKFYGRADLSSLICDEMAQAFSQSLGEIHFDAVCYVPSTALSRINRGFDHIARLARGLSKRLGLPVIKALRQTGKKKMQHMLRAAQRADNVRGVYTCCADVRGKTLLLVDDIVTTGATLNECTRVLKKNGAAAVYCITAAMSS